MNNIVKISSILYLCSTLSVLAQNNQYLEKAIDVDDLSQRMTNMKADEYTRITMPAHRTAHNMAQRFEKKEVDALVKMKNRVQKRISRLQQTAEPETIKIDTNDKQAVEKFLTPRMNTYDELAFPQQ